MKEKPYRVTWEVIEEIAVLYESQSGWTKELNRVSWNGDETKYDVRWWNPNKTRIGKGFTFTPEEMKSLKEIMDTEIPNLS